MSVRFSSLALAMATAAGIAASACGSSSSGSSPDDGDDSEGSAPGGSDGQGAAGRPGSGAAGSGGGAGSDVARSAGCGRAPALTSGPQSLASGGNTRTFILDLPSSYDRSRAYPLVFGFHGRGFSAAEFRDASYGDLLSVAGAEAILVHPDALGEPERAWDTESMQDVQFFDALLDELSDALCIDQARVFAAGHSSGAYFLNTLACRRGDALRAIAPVAGGGPFGTGGDAPSCTGPVSAWIAHARDDETVLFENGENSRDYWLERDGCDEDRSDEVAPPPCVAYEGCAAGLAVNWCAYDGGHDWPSFAARGIWNFFKRF